ncbi:SEC-C domain-containing protein [Sulfurovum sp. XTW-4]|uniref:SEC-C domain-containing protein n=1 Tax=Sulfurovum xiamenensis TaxID=3019066 RepID=A0ABT7QTN6_9BACT|nr:SEC-C domain-containing protein [Sulfurovum xiamenensis]MDM5263944.1 SEC-C domain-containing protein [Sulfurovum xiamenensis]
MDIDPSKDFIINVCGNKFINTSNIIEIDDKNILSIYPPENKASSIPRISASFFDDNNNEIAWICENEWFGSINAFDIQTKGNTITIRKKLGKYSLVLQFLPENNIVIKTLDLSYNNVNISGSEGKEFYVKTSKSELVLPSGDSVSNKVPFWLSIKGNKIYVGSTNIINYETLNGTKYTLPGYREIDNIKLSLSKNGGNQDTLKIESKGGISGVGFHYDLPEVEQKTQQIKLVWNNTEDHAKKCACGSGKLYKNCCNKLHTRLEKLLNSSFKLQQKMNEVQSIYRKPLSFHFDSNNERHISFGVNEQNVLVNINKQTGLSIENLIFAFLSAIYHKNGFYVPEKQYYNDKRERVIRELSSVILHIPITAEMSREGFKISNFFNPTLDKMKTTLDERDKEEALSLPIFRIHYEAIVFTRINFQGLYLTRRYIDEMKNLFQQKSPHALLLAKKLIKIMNDSSPYEQNGVLQANYKCIKLLNSIEENEYFPGFTPDPYKQYLDDLERKALNIFV